MSTSTVQARIHAAQAATLTLIEHTLAAATKALCQPDTPPATLREARLAATAAARTLCTLAHSLTNDPPPPPPPPKRPPPPRATAESRLPSGITIADLVAVLETNPTTAPATSPPRKPSAPSTPAALLSRVGGLDPPRS